MDSRNRKHNVNCHGHHHAYDCSITNDLIIATDINQIRIVMTVMMEDSDDAMAVKIGSVTCKWGTNYVGRRPLGPVHNGSARNGGILSGRRRTSYKRSGGMPSGQGVRRSLSEET